MDADHPGNGVLIARRSTAALMAHAVEVCDRQGNLAYLESTKPSNVPFYERFGVIRYEMIVVGGYPPMTTRVRRPR